MHVPVGCIGTVLFENASTMKDHILNVHHVDPVEIDEVIEYHRIRGEDDLVSRFVGIKDDGEEDTYKVCLYWVAPGNANIYKRMLACVVSDMCTTIFDPTGDMEGTTKEFMSFLSWKKEPQINNEVANDDDSDITYSPRSPEYN